jgi:hypothetical protein
VSKGSLFSHLALDVSEPLVGWEAFFAAKGIEVASDHLGRPSVARHVVADLLDEQREREARLAEEAANAATLNQPVPVVAVPAREGLSAHENIWLRTATRPSGTGLERSPRPSFLDGEFARTREHQRAEQEVARRKEKAK